MPTTFHCGEIVEVHAHGGRKVRAIIQQIDTQLRSWQEYTQTLVVRVHEDIVLDDPEPVSLKEPAETPKGKRKRKLAL